MSPVKAQRVLRIAGTEIEPGTTNDLRLEVSERYTGVPVQIPLRVIRARELGPAVFVSAAVHGDELNGTGIVRDLMNEQLELTRGSVVLAPIINVLGFEAHARYLPDRRDLNRSFPGSPRGSMASRIAATLMREIITNCDYGIDLHTAATGRTNFPHIRANLAIEGIEPLARAFGCEVIVNQRGNAATLRSVACRSGCLTILLEGGESLKIEPWVVRIGVRGVHNVLRHLGMLEGPLEPPAYQTVATKTLWVRSPSGGLLRFHVGPGAILARGAAVATVENLATGSAHTVKSPIEGIIIGMPTMPAVKPGDPICHIAVPSRSCADIRREIAAARRTTLHRHVQRAQATDVAIYDFEGDEGL